MTVQLRVSGNPDEIDVMVNALSAVFDLTGSARRYPNHGTTGVRAYLTARIPSTGDRETPPRGDGHE